MVFQYPETESDIFFFGIKNIGYPLLVPPSLPIFWWGGRCCVLFKKMIYWPIAMKFSTLKFIIIQKPNLM